MNFPLAMLCARVRKICPNRDTSNLMDLFQLTSTTAHTLSLSVVSIMFYSMEYGGHVPCGVTAHGGPSGPLQFARLEAALAATFRRYSPTLFTAIVTALLNRIAPDISSDLLRRTFYASPGSKPHVVAG
jgi:hypothetical protein